MLGTLLVNPSLIKSRGYIWIIWNKIKSYWIWKKCKNKQIGTINKIDHDELYYDNKVNNNHVKNTGHTVKELNILSQGNVKYLLVLELAGLKELE